MQDLIEKVAQALELARRGGADAAEAYAIDAPEDAVSFEPSAAGQGAVLRTAITVPKKGLGLTARWGDRVGFASTTDLSDAALAATLEAAREAAIPEDPPLPLTPPSPAALAAPPGVSGLIDRRLLEMNLPDLVEATRDIAGETVAEGALVLEAIGLACCRQVAVGNSLGLRASGIDTRIGAAVYAATGGGGLAGWVRGSRSLDGLKALHVGRTAALTAKSAEQPRDVVAGRQTVVLRPDAVFSLLAGSLAPALGADRVLEGRSPFGPSSLGETVASAVLSLTDDPTRPAATGSYCFDAEGVPGRVTPLIESGRLVSFLHNSRTATAWNHGEAARHRSMAAVAARPGARPGNASRDRSDRMSTFVEPSGLFGYRPGIAPSNLVATAPGATFPSIGLAGVDKGLLVNDVMGAFVIDPAVGDFSVTTTNAWALERGRSAYPVKRAMLTGNVYSLLKQVSALAEEPGEVTGPFSLYSPSWVVADLTVV